MRERKGPVTLCSPEPWSLNNYPHGEQNYISETNPCYRRNVIEVDLATSVLSSEIFGKNS